MLEIMLSDNVKGRVLSSDGKYHEDTSGDSSPINSQEVFLALSGATNS